MAAMVAALSTRIKYLQSLRQHTSEEEMRRTVMDTECNINQCMDKYPYTISLDIATTLIEVLSEDTTIFSEQFRQSMIEKINGKLATHRAINDVDAILPAGTMHVKQTMMYPENYFTEDIWRRILDGEAREADVYMPIVGLLVRVGLSRPQETFWGSLVATVQWGRCSPNFDAAHVRDTMKSMWKHFRFIIPTIPDAPTEYPTTPSKLLDTHPVLYERAYPIHQPVAPPSHLEPIKLSWLRSTTGSRCTKKPLIGAVNVNQWHVMAHETMLVFGKMCP